LSRKATCAKSKNQPEAASKNLHLHGKTLTKMGTLALHTG